MTEQNFLMELCNNNSKNNKEQDYENRRPLNLLNVLL